MKTIKGMQRMAPKVMKRHMLSKKAATASGRGDLEAGNFTNAPTSKCLKQMRSESRRKKKLDADPWLNLVKQAESLENEYGSGSVFIQSYRPLKVAWATKKQCLFLQNEASRGVPVVVGLDATGSEVRRPKWAKEKQIYTYNMAFKRNEKDSPLIPITSFISNDHHDSELFNWLTRFKLRFSEVLGTSNKKIPIKAYITDLGLALTNAVLWVFSEKMSLHDFLKACEMAYEMGKLDFPLLCWCYAHYTVVVKQRIFKLLPLTSHKFSPGRKFVQNVMAELSRATDFDEALEMFRLFAIILLSQSFTTLVKNAIGTISIRLGGDTSYIIDEEFVEEDVIPPCKPARIVDPEEDPKWKNFTYKESPFYKSFWEIFERAKKEVEDHVEENPPRDNPLYVPTFLDYSLRYLFPFFPLWSRYVQKFVFPANENPLSNSNAENLFRRDKEETLDKKTYQEISEVMRLLIEEGEKRLLEVEFNTDFCKHKKKTTEEEDITEVEIWRPQKKRLPGGFFSKDRVSLYARSLMNKVKKAAVRQAKAKSKQNGKVVKRKKTKEIKFAVATFPLQRGESVNNERMESPIDGLSEGTLVNPCNEQMNSPIDGLPEGTLVNPCNEQMNSPLDGLPEGTLVNPCNYSDSENILAIPCDTISTLHPVWKFTETEHLMETTLPDGTVVQAFLYDLSEGREIILQTDSNGLITGMQFVDSWATQDFSSSRIPVLNEMVDLATDRDGFVGSCSVINNEVEIAPEPCPPSGSPGLPHSPSKRTMHSKQNQSAIKPLPWSEALTHPIIPEEMPYKCEGVKLASFDFDSLIEGSWLTDNILDAFALLMVKKKADEWSEVFTVTSQATENVTFNVTSYVDVLSKSDILLNDMWLVPAHIERNHWVLFVVLVKSKRILILDPLHRAGSISASVKLHLQILRVFMKQSHLFIHHEDINWGEWTIHAPNDIPRQENGFDCGVFVCLWMYSICCSVILPQDVQKQVNLAREWIKQTILLHSVLEEVQEPDTTKRRPELIGAWYNEADEKIKTGELVVDKVWLAIPDPVISFTPLTNSTSQFLATIMSSFYEATDVDCGLKLGCFTTNEDMYLCVLCREYLHLKCIRDKRPAPPKSVPFVCPKHPTPPGLETLLESTDKTKTRVVTKPLRLRRSLGG